MKQKYAVYQLVMGHPALISADLTHEEAGIMVDSNEGYNMCTMAEWEELKNYV